MKRKILSTFVLSLIMTSLLLAGCGQNDPGPSDVSSGQADQIAGQTAEQTADQATEAASDAAPDAKDNTISDTSGSGTETSGDQPTDADTSDTAGAPLYERLCGKYSYKYGEDCCYILDITSFGENLYAFGGEAYVEDDEDYIEAYSFWAMEIFPENADDLKSADADSIDVGVMYFSIMSNLGQYWSAPDKGTISVTDGGVILEGISVFDNDGQTEDKLVFEKDDSVEDMFVYMSKRNASSDEITGLWRQDGEDNPVFLQFTDEGNIFIYQKDVSSEVTFMGGKYALSDSKNLMARLSRLDTGDMPYELSAVYLMDDDMLVIKSESADEVLGNLTEAHLPYKFKRADISDIPVIALKDLAEAGLDDSRVYSIYDMADETEAPEEPFYGVWVSALKDADEAYAVQDKLADEGFDACVLYSPDWSNLSTEPYYCVTAGCFAAKDDAETALEKAKSAGYKDAYVKYSGDRRLKTIDYTVYSLSDYEFKPGKVIVKDVSVSSPGETGTGSTTRTLTVDENTVFDKSCELDFFGNYEDGMTPLEWFEHNKDLADNDPDAYMMYGPALSGVFRVTVTGDHIDSFIGCYWWD